MCIKNFARPKTPSQPQHNFDLVNNQSPIKEYIEVVAIIQRTKEYLHNQRMAIHYSLITLILMFVCTASKEIESHFTPSIEGHRHLKGGKRRRKRVAQTQSQAPPNNMASFSRIVGGSPAGAGTYPFIVSLYSVNDPTGLLPSCGK